jgi:hypothetical protein
VMGTDAGIAQRSQSHDFPHWLCAAWPPDSKLICDMGGAVWKPF